MRRPDVDADDFGLNAGVNAGIVMSASLMVRRGVAEAPAQRARAPLPLGDIVLSTFAACPPAPSGSR